MNALVLTVRCPLLGAKGDQIAAYRRIKTLAEHGYKVTVIHIRHASEKQSNQQCAELNKIGVNVKTLIIKNGEMVWSLFLALFNKKIPLQVALYSSKWLMAELDRLINENQPDIILAITARSCGNISEKWFGKLCVDFVDALSLNLSRRADSLRYPIRYLYKIESKRMKVYENIMARKVKKCWVVSVIDRSYIGAENINVLPVPVDDADFSINNYRNGKRVIFTGNMNYYPNVEAIKWFLFECWDKILMREPDASFDVIGRAVSEDLKKYVLMYPSTKVVGEVISMNDEIANSAVSVAPMLSGSGMQLKILEAMSCAVPVVTTRLGLGDISAINGEAVLVTDSPDQYAEYVAALLTDSQKRNAIGVGGQKYVKQYHSTENIGKKFINQMSL